MNHRSLVAAIAVGTFASLGFAETARAGDVVSFGVGALGAVDANFLGKPGDRTVILPNGKTALDESYPGFGGVNGGGGFMAEVRFLKVVGLEIDVLRTGDRGHGDINASTIDIGQGAWHLPILVKGVIPTGFVQPFAVIGPEFVFPGEATATVTPTPPIGSTTFAAHAGGYTMLTFGLGVEFKLPIPGVDIRIPFSARGSVNPGTSDKVSDRGDYKISGNAFTAIDYKSEWQYRVALTLGAGVYF